MAETGNPVTDVPKKGFTIAKKFWNASKGIWAGLALSTAIAVATGGVSLPFTAAAAGGGTLAVTPTAMLTMTGQGLVHNAQGIAGGLQSGAEGLASLMAPAAAT